VKTSSFDGAVLVGLDEPDDAGVYQLAPDLAIVQTVDFFTPIVDDPWAWGRIAAANALSDIYAMGARPITALNLVAWPRELDFELLGRVLEGGAEACAEAGVSVIGGHSVDDPEPKFGLAVTGTVHPDHIIRNAGAAPGADLILTKPLGMGIISSAIKEGRASPDTVARAVAIMGRLNRPAAEAMVEIGVEAATDVTGFGLMIHLRELLGPRLAATLHFGAIPLLDEAIELAADGILSGGSKRNIEAARDFVDASALNQAEQAVLFDAQTSGGLLIAVSADKSTRLLERLHAQGVEDAERIGTVGEGSGEIAVIR
jgi:selenide, water dikinase